MFKFKKHKSDKLTAIWYCSLSWPTNEKTADFDKVFKIIEKHNLVVRDLRFYNGNVVYGSDGRHVLSFGLEGTWKNLNAYIDECYENEELEFFNPSKD